jgi:hypothetical protein
MSQAYKTTGIAAADLKNVAISFLIGRCEELAGPYYLSQKELICCFIALEQPNRA